MRATARSPWARSTAAQAFYETALGLTSDDDPARPLLLFRIGEARFNNEEPDYDLLVAAAAALRDAGNLQAASEAQVMLAHVAWRFGQHDRAFGHFERATALIDRHSRRFGAGQRAQPAHTAFPARHR